MLSAQHLNKGGMGGREYEAANRACELFPDLALNKESTATELATVLVRNGGLEATDRNKN